MHLNSQIFSPPRQSLSVSPLSVSLTLSPVDRGSHLGPSKSMHLSLRVAALSDSRHRSLSPPHQLRYTLWTSLKFYVFFKKSDFEAQIWRIGARFIFAWPLYFLWVVEEMCGKNMGLESCLCLSLLRQTATVSLPLGPEMYESVPCIVVNIF